MKRSLFQLLIAILIAATLLHINGTEASAETPADTDFEITWNHTDPITRALGAGQCYGYFHLPDEINGFVEWGADTHCSGSNWIPHQLKLTLQKQRHTTWFPDIFFDDVATMSSEPFQFAWPDISLHDHNTVICTSANKRKFRIAAILTAGPHSTTALSDEVELNCDF